MRGPVAVLVLGPWPYSVALYALAQAIPSTDTGGVVLNIATLAVVTGVVGTLAGAIALMYRNQNASQARQIDRLTEERDALLGRLLDTVATADRAAEAGERAGHLLQPLAPTSRKRRTA